MYDKKQLEKERLERVKELNEYRFCSSYQFETGMRQIIGDKAYHSADYAAMPREAKRLMVKAIQKLRKRIDEIITMDERLRERLFSELDCLEREVRRIDQAFNEMEIIGVFFNIISRLLGYDWVDGKTYRTPIYFRTKSQELAEYYNRKVWGWHERGLEDIDLVLERYRFAKSLKEKGLVNNQIARVLNITEYAVRQILKDKAFERMQELRAEGLNHAEIMGRLLEEGWHKYDAFFNEMGAARMRLSTPPV